MTPVWSGSLCVCIEVERASVVRLRVLCVGAKRKIRLHFRPVDAVSCFHFSVGLHTPRAERAATTRRPDVNSERWPRYKALCRARAMSARPQIFESYLCQVSGRIETGWLGLSDKSEVVRPPSSERQRHARKLCESAHSAISATDARYVASDSASLLAASKRRTYVWACRIDAAIFVDG